MSKFSILFLGALWAVATQAATLAPPVRSTFFDGSSRVTYPHRAEYNATVPMTIEAWIFVESTNGFQTIVSHNFHRSYYLGLESNQELRFYRSGGFPNFEDSDLTVPMERWTHVAVTYDGVKARFYIDGRPAGDGVLSNTGPNRHEELWIGNDPNGDLGFHGGIDEVRIWNRVRSEAEIRTDRFREIHSATGLVVRVPGGTFRNTVADVPGTVQGAMARQWGVLPRDYVVPQALTPINEDWYLGEFRANRAERIIWRYRTRSGEEKDVEGMMLYRDTLYDRNLYVAIPETPGRAHRLDVTQDLWFSAIIQTNGTGNEFPDDEVLRIDSSADNLTAGVATNVLRRGSGSGYVAVDTPPSGPGSWDVVPATGCEHECGRIFRIPESMLGGFEGRKLGLFGQFAYRSEAGRAEYELPSTFDADSQVPFTWPFLSFGPPAVSLPRIELTGRVYDGTPGGSGVVPEGSRIHLLSADDGTIFDSRRTTAEGYFGFSTTVYPPNVRLRVLASPATNGVWRSGTPSVTRNDVPAQDAGILEGLLYEPLPGPGDHDLGEVRYPMMAHRPPAIHGFEPSSGMARLVLRISPYETTQPTRFQLTGTNLHPFTHFYLSRETCDLPYGTGAGLPSGFRCTNFPLRVVSRAPDWSRVELELAFDLDARLNVPGESWVRGPYRILCHDTWMHQWTASAANFSLAADYPKVHGFEFKNERDGTQFDEFSSVFKWNAYDCITPVGPLHGANPCIGCRVPSPVYLGFYSLIFTPWAEAMSGSCIGMASTSLQFARRELRPEDFDPMARYAGGLQGVQVPDDDGVLRLRAPKPQQHDFRTCDYSVPRNLWAHIHRNQVAQISSEFIHMTLDQMSGTGLAPHWDYSVDGDPSAVLARVRPALGDYVLGFHFSGDILKAHSVVPYAVFDGFGYDTNTHSMVVRSNSTAIMVYDNNDPKDSSRFIEIDRDNNTYRYYWDLVEKEVDGVTTNVHEYWTGTGIYAYPISFFDQALHMPGADLAVRTIKLLLFGEADALYHDDEGDQWGWTRGNEFLNTYAGAKAFAPLAGSTEAMSNNSRGVFFLPPTNSPPRLIQANVRGPQYRFFAGEAGVIGMLVVEDAVPGETDQLRVKTETGSGLLKGYSFQPESARQQFTPRLGIISTNVASVLYEWEGLKAGPDAAVEFAGTRSDATAAYANRGGLPTRHILRIYRNGPEGLETNEFGPFDIPSGAVHRTAFTGWPAPTLRSEIDLDDDGVPESTAFLTPVGEEGGPVLQAHRIGEKLELSWTEDEHKWELIRTSELNASGAVWKRVVTKPLAVEGRVRVVIPFDQEKSFFRLRRVD